MLLIDSPHFRLSFEFLALDLYMEFGDGEYGGGGEGKSAAETCSVCLEAVTAGGERSSAELQCGHIFHLDCIGSAFNIKGAMQCPNCRQIEKGQWLYANGSRALPETTTDDWAGDEDSYDISFAEMSFGVQWCPVSGLTRLPTSFEEGEFQSSAYHDLLGQGVSTTHPPCPYITYVGPIHPSSSTSNQNGQSATGETYPFLSMDVNYHIWDHTPYTAGSHHSSAAAEQPSIPSMTQTTSRNNYDVPRSGMHPFIIGHSSANRAPAPGSVASSIVPTYHLPSLEAYIQQSSGSQIAQTSLTSFAQSRTSNQTGLAQAAPMVSSSADQLGQFYYYSSNSSGRAFQETANTLSDPAFPTGQVSNNSIWGPFQFPTSGSSTSYHRRRHRSERMPSQNWL
ncbi:E3 ubiquitin-protein ligase IPI1-like isoform X2 [Andrographis paniculata]|uniref:E3 ubiquitin-protein ligase IPI1-like isoform X2 n=1 Tax=Andrographis paniculata TaxID=175694 RepID=UPI0021E8BC76|nr:E3 ubiquitin-protein ligase IPI1-like isoform X2 [Andrographis paniculata]